MSASNPKHPATCTCSMCNYAEFLSTEETPELVKMERERIATELDRLADVHFGTGTDAVLIEFAKELRR